MSDNIENEILWQNNRISILKKGSENEKMLDLLIDGEFTIYSMQKLKDFFLEILHQYTSFKIDLSQVKEFDSAGMQFIIALKAEASLFEKKISYYNHSNRVLEYMDLYGAIGLLGDKIVLPKGEKDRYSLKYGLKKQRLEFLGAK